MLYLLVDFKVLWVFFFKIYTFKKMLQPKWLLSRGEEFSGNSGPVTCYLFTFMTLSVFPMIFGRRVILVSVCFQYIKLVKSMLSETRKKNKVYDHILRRHEVGTQRKPF